MSKDDLQTVAWQWADREVVLFGEMSPDKSPEWRPLVLRSAALSRIEALERERDAALRSRDDWIRENGPGGWIDALRNLAKERAIQNETLMRALEIIAVGDSKSPAADAKEALVEAGLWTKEQA